MSRRLRVDERYAFTDEGGGRTSVKLAAGGVVASVPHATPEYEARAAALGYPDGAAMSREHDRLHAELAAVFDADSPVLLDVASGEPDANRWQEEELVKLVAWRLNHAAADELPGGGYVAWLRARLRP